MLSRHRTRPGVNSRPSSPTLPPRPPNSKLPRCTLQGAGQLGEVQYLRLSDALNGAPIASVGQSTARSSAAMLSVAVKVGSTRLLDNVMLVGTPDDLGEPGVA